MKCKSKIGRRLTLSATVCATLAGCQMTTLNIETSKALCQAWEDTLFLPSRADTPETARGLTQQRKTQRAACS